MPPAIVPATRLPPAEASGRRAALLQQIVEVDLLPCPTVLPRPGTTPATRPTPIELPSAQGLHRLHDEDPTFETHYTPETHEAIVAVLGERQIDVSRAKLQRTYCVSAELTRPRIAYRETITASGEGQGRHK